MGGPNPPPLMFPSSDSFFLVLWQKSHCSLQTKTSMKAVLCQRNRTMPL